MFMSKKISIFWFVVLPNTVLLYAGLYVALLLRYGLAPTSKVWSTHVQAFTPLFFLWLLVLFIHNVFDVATFRRYSVLFFNLVLGMTVNVFVAITYFYFQPELILTPRRLLLILVTVTFFLLLLWHLLVKYFLKNKFTQELYLFSFNNELSELEKEIKRHDYLGFKVLGHLNEQTLFSVQFSQGFGIILPSNLEAKPEVLARVYQLRKLGVSFYNHTVFYEDLLRRVYLARVHEAWFLENISYTQKPFYALVKRVIDFVCGVFGLLVFAVTFPILALAIKLTSSGPVLFIQERVGLRGKVFKVYKYRTMNGPISNTWTSINDPRITSFGKFLRMSRIDELPQCINLLLGTMSLVGPRPEQVHLVETLRASIPFYDERHTVKPGITGWAQINDVYAATKEETELKLQYDLYYIKHRSLLFDLEIMLKTIYYVLSWRGR